MPISPGEVIKYWLGPKKHTPESFKRQQRLWYSSNDKTDAYINEHFGKALRQAEIEELDWHDSIDGQLALVILLDQFSRNLYRGTADAYKNDELAQQPALGLINAKNDKTLSVPARIVLYHPLHHAEDLALQRRAVVLFEVLLQDSEDQWHESISNNLKFIKSHCSIVERFGHFPHRNKLLGRTSTKDEQDYLAKDKRSYGQ
jgi:uncharacterized protein (DUF924 family)